MNRKPVFMKIFMLCCIAVFLTGSVSAEERSIKRRKNAEEQRVALVIGNADYKDAPLRNPVNDAGDIADTLKQIGFEIIYKENAGRKEMEEAVREFGKQLGSGGVGLFYFSGHGLQLNGRNYLIPVDAKIESESDIDFETVDAGRVLGKMQDAENSLNIVILDACRNNPFSKGFKSLGAGSRGLAKMNAPAGSIIAYATSPDSTASDGTGKNGVYTQYLLKYMKTPGLTIENMLKKTRIDVARETGNKQIPWEHSSLMTDFYFTPAPEKESSLIVRPDVSDATVWINDKKMGTGTLNFRQIQPGVYRIKVERDGYLPYQTPLEIKEGEAKELPVYLAKPEPEPEPVPESVSPEKKIINSIGMEFVYIPPGTFMMGSPENGPGRDRDEKQHRVTLTKGFYMQTTEVTQGQWKAVMGNNPSYFENCGDNCPAERVSWDDVQVFIEKLNRKDGRNYRLPTEAEWEYACRAGSGTPFVFGKCLSADQANYNGKYPCKYPLFGCPKGEYRGKSVPVASFTPNAWGLYDMQGNAVEWCQDWYGDYPSGSVTDPAGPSSGSRRVGRGGGWNDGAAYCRSANRIRYSPDSRNDSLGFRPILPAGQQR